MKASFGRVSIKKILISITTGIVVFLATWLYLNSYYTLTIEDGLLSKEIFLKHKLIKQRPKENKQFVFISTGKDLSLIDDTSGYGNIAVSDRYKLFKLLQAINKASIQPKFILLDLQFYYPYNFSVENGVEAQIKKNDLQYLFPSKIIDDSLREEINKSKSLAISVLMKNNKIDTPIYKAAYGIADYKTYGSFMNKFRINYGNLNANSIPSLLYQKIDGAVYSTGNLINYCNQHLCFNYIWPDYYYDENDVKNDSTYQYYHIGSLLGLLKIKGSVETIFKNKVVFIGNFEDDVHDTPAGKIPGTIILADIYLSLLNGTHYVPYLWIIFVMATFSLLSYFAIYKQIPEVNFNFKFKFADQLSSFLKEYVSYIGVMLLLSLLSVLIFNITISLFLPAFIFSLIDFFVNKKYKPKNEKI